ncbi:death-associated protein-like 1-B isoform X1 [Polyodon spathula]|uniref:death-associated protein-like 1-B isoform X1 n=1 Tax=Polyodon spathula TaxID=7913 RepID=UPI001B7EF3FB|nr:death-associated protein-like 1-B isoform X1 [Polyodon spathula]
MLLLIAVLKMVQLSKAGVKENPSLKAGHPPAGLRLKKIKAGGKRLAKKQGGEENAPSETEAKKPTAEKRSLAVFSRMQSISILLAGTLDKLSREFPAAAASVAYNKPRPAVEKLHTPKKLYLIQQPRKC